jgi:hypothetical protein
MLINLNFMRKIHWGCFLVGLPGFLFLAFLFITFIFSGSYQGNNRTHRPLNESIGYFVCFSSNDKGDNPIQNPLPCLDFYHPILTEWFSNPGLYTNVEGSFPATSTFSYFPEIHFFLHERLGKLETVWPDMDYAVI